MLLIGKCLGTSQREVNGPSGTFISKSLHVLDGLHSQEVRLSREFPTSDLPREGEEVALNVVVSAFAGRSGAQVQVTALDRPRDVEALVFKRSPVQPVAKPA